jgi:hypothetical protein
VPSSSDLNWTGLALDLPSSISLAGTARWARFGGFAALPTTDATTSAALLSLERKIRSLAPPILASAEALSLTDLLRLAVRENREARYVAGGKNSDAPSVILDRDRVNQNADMVSRRNPNRSTIIHLDRKWDKNRRFQMSLNVSDHLLGT